MKHMNVNPLIPSRYHCACYVALALAAFASLSCSHASQPGPDINIDVGVWNELRALSEDFVRAAAEGDTATVRDMISGDVESNIVGRVGERFPWFRAAADSVVSWSAAYYSTRDTVGLTMVLSSRNHPGYCYYGEETDDLYLEFTTINGQWKVSNYGYNIC